MGARTPLASFSVKPARDAQVDQTQKEGSGVVGGKKNNFLSPKLQQHHKAEASET
jgi:hypothetical protein